MKKRFVFWFCFVPACFFCFFSDLGSLYASLDPEKSEACLKSHPHYNTALHLLYKEERDRFQSPPEKKKRRRHNRLNKRESFFDKKSALDKGLSREILPPNPEEKINIYRTMTIDMALATGNVVLDNSTANQFSIDEFGSLNLTLQDYSTIRQNTEVDVTLKEDDIINIDGKGAVIEVTGNFYVNGKILFSEDTDLTFKFTDGDARLIFAPGSLGDLEKSVEVHISGRGVAEAKDGFVVTMNGDQNNIEELPVFVIEDHTTFMPSDGATNTIKGVGKVLVRDGAVVDIQGFGESKHLIIGDSKTDFIPIEVRDSAMIRLEGGDADVVRQNGYAPPSGNLGHLSIQKANSNIKVWLGGILYIGDKGWLELNTLNAELAQGYITEIDFNQGGNFFLKSGGLFSCATNKDCQNCGSLAPIIWFGEDANFRGTGLAEYIGRSPASGRYTYQGFVGVFQPNNGLFNSPDGVEILELIKILINENDNLTTAIEFTDHDGIKKVRLKNGKQIAITSGDTLTGEDSVGNVLGLSASGDRVLYGLNGSRSLI